MELPVRMNSLWEATGPTWQHEHLTGPLHADLVVVGAGITGLAAALQASSSGRSVVVVDAHYPGWGASGRNGGQVIPGLKYLPDEITREYGEERGNHIIDLAGGTADHVFDLIDKHGLDCDASRGGWLEPAYRPRPLRVLEQKASQWKSRGADVEFLDGPAACDITGGSGFIGGFHDRRAGSLQPLKYSMALGEAARKAGARILSDVRVTDIDRNSNGFAVKSKAGTIEAGQVLLCTNGYTDPSFAPMAKPLGRSVAQVASIQIATDPLPDHLRDRIMAGRISGSDTNRLLVYFRQDAEGRFLIGGRGATFAGGLERLFPVLQKNAIRIFPDLKDVPFTYRWGGLLALTADHLPHIHEPVPGFLIAIGYNGRGVALATQWGTLLADYAASGDANILPLPFSPVKKFPFHRLRTAGIEIAAFWYGILDRLGV